MLRVCYHHLVLILLPISIFISPYTFWKSKLTFYFVLYWTSNVRVRLNFEYGFLLTWTDLATTAEHLGNLYFVEILFEMGNRTTGRYGKGTAAKPYFLEQTVGKRTLPRKKGWEYYCNQLRSLGTQGHQHWHLVSFCLLPGLIIRFLFPCCCEKNWQCSEMMVTGSNDKCSLGHWEFLCSILTEIEKGFCTYLIFAPSVAVCCQGELRFELAICIHFAI